MVTTLRNEFNARGYQIASSSGENVDYTPSFLSNPGPLFNWGVGILEPKQRKLGIFKQRADYVGQLWLNNEKLGATTDSSWVLEVYGTDNVPKLTQMVENISGEDISVKVVLGRETPKQEVYRTDGAL